jgi:hypothetical protein
VLKAGFRYGDSAPMAVIELVDRDEMHAARIQALLKWMSQPKLKREPQRSRWCKPQDKL